MKRTILIFITIASSTVLFAQDQMPTNRAADLSGRTAARDMNKTVTPPALPVYNTYVSPEIMSRTTGSYGQKLYSITQVKDAMGENAYQLTLLENGQTKQEWVSESGTAVANIFRTAETDSLVALRDANNAGMNSMNNNSMNGTNNTGTNNSMNNVTNSQQNVNMNNATNSTNQNNATTRNDSMSMQRSNNANMVPDTSNRMNNAIDNNGANGSMNNTQLNANSMNNNNGTNTGTNDANRTGTNANGNINTTNNKQNKQGKDTKSSTTKPKENQ